MLSGLHSLRMLVTKTRKKDGSPYKVLLKIFAGTWFHSKMKLSYGRKQVKRIATVQGIIVVTCIDKNILHCVYSRGDAGI